METETCIKQLSPIGRAIEVMPFEDWFKFVVEISKQQKAQNEGKTPKQELGVHSD